VIRSILYLRPRRGDGGAVADFYRRHGVLERATEQDGCLGAELQLPVDGEGDVLVTALWRDPESYQGWLDNPARSAHAEELAEVVDGVDEDLRGALYHVAVWAAPAR
jgi:heme-degrading monooxygenase HmoA